MPRVIRYPQTQEELDSLLSLEELTTLMEFRRFYM
jgi:hypothetical protein